MKRVSTKAGTTLIEMLVVIAIIGLIVAFLVPNVVGQLGRARFKTAQLQLNSVASAIQLYRDDVGRFPTEAEGVSALVTQPAGVTAWTGPYVAPGQVRDPWDNPILYRLDTAKGFEVTSLGADGKPGGQGANRDVSAPEAR